MEAVSTFETQVNLYHTTRDIPEGRQILESDLRFVAFGTHFRFRTIRVRLVFLQLLRDVASCVVPTKFTCLLYDEEEASTLKTCLRFHVCFTSLLLLAVTLTDTPDHVCTRDACHIFTQNNLRSLKVEVIISSYLIRCNAVPSLKHGENVITLNPTESK